MNRDQKRVLAVAAFLALLCAPAMLDQDVLREAAESPQHFGLPYIRAPLAAASACVLFLAPGLLLALSVNAGATLERWFLAGFGISLPLVSVAAAVAQSVLGGPLRGSAFVVVLALCALGAMGVVMARARRGPIRWPECGVTRVVALTLPPLLLVAALGPKIHWENFNPDGVHAFEAARLLLFQPVPFFEQEAGPLATYPGATTMLFPYPASWFLRLFGEVEAAARLPAFLSLSALYAALVCLVEHGRKTTLGWRARALIWTGLTSYSVVMAFSATYDSHTADIALPAAASNLVLACFVGFLVWFLEGRRLLLSLFTALAWFSQPSAMPLLALWLLAVASVFPERPWRRMGIVLAVLLVCMALTAALPAVLSSLGQPVPGREHAGGTLLARLGIVQWGDWRRLIFLLVPSGILPALSMLAWRWQDPVARALTATTLGYFGLFFVQAFGALHQFSPAMVLPLAVMWRFADRWPKRRTALEAVAFATGVIAMALCWPRDAQPGTAARRLGESIEIRIAGYDQGVARYYRDLELLWSIVPPDYGTGLGNAGSPEVWSYYARGRDSRATVDYILQPAASPEPTGFWKLDANERVALYARSQEALAGHRSMRRKTRPGSALFEIPPWMLFRQMPPPGKGPVVVDVHVWLKQHGIDLSFLNRR